MFHTRAFEESRYTSLNYSTSSSLTTQSHSATQCPILFSGVSWMIIALLRSTSNTVRNASRKFRIFCWWIQNYFSHLLTGLVSFCRYGVGTCPSDSASCYQSLNEVSVLMIQLSLRCVTILRRWAHGVPTQFVDPASFDTVSKTSSKILLFFW